MRISTNMVSHRLRQGRYCNTAKTAVFFNEINRARLQAHSMLLRLMAERSAHAFNREYHFPHLTVFADRNRLEREETFELPAAARDRFFMEINISAPNDFELQRALMFDFKFLQVDKMIAGLPEAVVPYTALNNLYEAIQNRWRRACIPRLCRQFMACIKRPCCSGDCIRRCGHEPIDCRGASPTWRCHADDSCTHQGLARTA